MRKRRNNVGRRIPTKEAISEVMARLMQAAKHLNPLKRIPHPRITNGGRFDEEHFVLVLSDLQTGLLTPTYDMAVLKARMEYLVEKVLKIVAMHRKSHPVRKLSIFLIGDVVHGERVGFMIDLDHLERVVRDQMFNGAIPVLSYAIAAFAQVFETVDVFCVKGNHGKNGKFAGTTTNFDLFSYIYLQQFFSSTKHVTFHISDTFHSIADVSGFKFFLVHGDNIPMHLTLPWYGLTTRMMRWSGSVGDFNYLVCGHFHALSWMFWNDKQIFTNGTFITDDEWSIENIGLSGTCGQLLLSVHPKVGVSFVRAIQMQRAIPTCPRHLDYKGLHKPRTVCDTCLRLWRIRQKGGER